MELTRDIVHRLERTMYCTCHRDNWELDKRTGHSQMCRIHQTTHELLCKQGRCDDGSWKRDKAPRPSRRIAHEPNAISLDRGRHALRK